MINLRERKSFATNAFKIFKKQTHGTNAVMRSFGNSDRFPWGKLTRDFGVVGDLQDCSLLFFEVEDDETIDVINSFNFDELIFSRMTGETAQTNPHACLISKHDILHCYEVYEKTCE